MFSKATWLKRFCEIFALSQDFLFLAVENERSPKALVAGWTWIRTQVCITLNYHPLKFINARSRTNIYIYINIAFFPDPLKNGTNFPKQLLKLPTQRPSSLPWGPRPGPIEHLNFFYFYITSTNSLHCFLAHIARAQHISAEDGLYCPLQIKHLDLDLTDHTCTSRIDIFNRFQNVWETF